MGLDYLTDEVISVSIPYGSIKSPTGWTREDVDPVSIPYGSIKRPLTSTAPA